MDDSHFINELQQLILIQKKFTLSLQNKPVPKSDFSDVLDTLDSTDGITKKISELIAKKNTVPKDTLEKLHHELRTPMTPILGYTEMLLADKFGSLNDEQRKRTQVIHENTKRLLDTINNIDDILTPTGPDNTRFEINELKQEKKIATKLNNTLAEQLNTVKKERDDLLNTVTNSAHKKLEQAQEKIIMNKSIKIEQEKNLRLSKKHIMTMAGAAITVAVIATGYSILVVDLVGQQYQMTNLGEIKSGYTVQNLRGDTIDTWLSWRLVDGYTINVNLIDGEKYPDKADIVRDVILSEESIQIDNSLLHKGPKGTASTYYVGWTGALAGIDVSSEFYIPQKFNIIESSKGEGDITIKLTTMRSGDGYSGYTQSIADDSQNQILKSNITIYEVDKLSKAQFETILRHEFGHALGLAHSSATEDLMYPTIETDYPYISECDVDAITLLYDGGKKSEVVCEI